jgi:hypothetical protein
MRATGFAVFGAAVLLVFSGPASASCRCECVEGKVQSICESSLDVRTSCTFKECPHMFPSQKPLGDEHSPLVPPNGTSHCESKRVWNEEKKDYEWRKLCQ